MDALVFSWSGSFRELFAERHDEIAHIVGTVHDRGFQVGVVSEEPRTETEEAVAAQDIDFVVPQVENIVDVLSSLAQRYDRVFFVSDIRAELAAVNRSGAFTVGYNGEDVTADELGGVGPNYIVDGLDELEQILLLEEMA